MTITLSHEPVEVGQELLITAQLRVEVTNPEAMDTHALVSNLYAALTPARKIVERIGIAHAISLSMQPYEEDEDDDDQAG